MANFGPLTAEMCSGVWAPHQISTGFAFWRRGGRHDRCCLVAAVKTAVTTAPPVTRPVLTAVKMTAKNITAVTTVRYGGPS